MIFAGNTSTSVSSSPKNIPSDIKSFSVANKSGGGITLSIALCYGSTFTYILYNQAISAATSYIYSGEPIELPAGYFIYVAVSGSSDYYFTIE